MLNRATCFLLCGSVWAFIVPTSAFAGGSPFNWIFSEFGILFSEWRIPFFPPVVLQTSRVFTCDPGLLYTKACPHSFTVPAGVTKIDIELWGGGGGGGRGGSSTNKNWGGGGGAGGGLGGYYYNTGISVTPGTVLNIQVGGGGVFKQWSAHDGSGNSGAPSFVKAGTQTLASAFEGCGGYAGGRGGGGSGGTGGSSCIGAGGSGGAGGEDAGGGGGGGRGLSDSHGSVGGPVTSQYNAGGGGAGSFNDAPWAWGPGVKLCVNGKGGDGGTGGYNGLDGDNSAPGICGGGGGGGGGAGSPAYRSRSGTLGGYGGHGGSGRVIIYY